MHVIVWYTKKLPKLVSSSLFKMERNPIVRWIQTITSPVKQFMDMDPKQPLSSISGLQISFPELVKCVVRDTVEQKKMLFTLFTDSKVIMHVGSKYSADISRGNLSCLHDIYRPELFAISFEINCLTCHTL